MSRPAALRAEGLVKHYPGMKRAVLDGVSITLEPGETVAVTGPSGSGKSTLLYALSGLIEVDAGRVKIGDACPGDAQAWTRMRAGPVGLVFQDPWLLPTLSAAQNVELPMIGVEPSARLRAQRVREVLEQAGIAAMAREFPARLSGGERQRVAIARALVNRPRVILADEPTGELDSAHSARIMDLFARLAAEGSVALLIVTHDPAVAARCAREYRVDDGQGLEVAR